tara:strand:- start:7841 stop:9205 length:1365 start_codon:yes stop_codon:yes gene_type:complete
VADFIDFCSNEEKIKVAIVGSGPAGFYTADNILKSTENCEIDIFEQFPCPFGLIRFGVAPDHEKTRGVWRAFSKTAQNKAVQYFGNIQVGTDISIDELLKNYDAAVIAIGAGKDRPLTLAGSNLPGVFGSASFVNWYNSHPESANLNPNLNTDSVVIIGAGNVAIDVARVLLKTPSEMSNTDLATHASKVIHSAPIQDIYLVARRSAAEAKFTNVELREMGQLEQAEPRVDAGSLPDIVEAEMSDRDRRIREKNIETLRDFSRRSPGEKPKRLHFIFCAQPLEIIGNNKVERVIFEHTKIENGKATGTGKKFDIECGAVIAATGYRSEPLPGAPFDDERGVIPNDSGRVATGLYVAGWVKRGPSGVIGTNKIDARETVDLMLKDIGVGKNKPGRAAINLLLSERGCRAVNYSAWNKIQQAEEDAAVGDAPRAKFVNVEDMMSILDNNSIPDSDV